MERWLSWSKAHDWKSCVGHKPTEGSNPSLSAREIRKLRGLRIFFVQKRFCRGFEPERVITVKKSCQWQVFRRSARRDYAPSAGSLAQKRFPNTPLSARKIPVECGSAGIRFVQVHTKVHMGKRRNRRDTSQLYRHREKAPDATVGGFVSLDYFSAMASISHRAPLG